MPKAHAPQQRLESGVVAHRIELERRRNEHQGTVPFFEGAVQPLEDVLEILQSEMDEGNPHRRDIAVSGACRQLL